MPVRKVAHRGAVPTTAVGEISHRLHIGPADPEHDLEILVEQLGQRAYFADRLSRQKRDTGVLLTAWWDHHPIGDAYLWLEAAEEPELRKYLPGVPLLTHVEIRDGFRSRGIGTGLVSAAEKTLVERGYKQVALAVEISNVRAAKLYTRLGYLVWRHPSVPHVRCENLFDDSVEPPEICHIMVKDLC
jgi:GNAT superfamily N-acetyltransferase